MHLSNDSRRPLDRPTADLARVCRLLEKRAASMHGLLQSHGFKSTFQDQLSAAADYLKLAADTLELVTSTAPPTEENSKASLRGSIGHSIEWVGVGEKGKVQYDDPTQLTGNNLTVPVADFVSFLATLGKSGVLWVDTLEETFQIELSGGEITYVSSNNPPSGGRLGEILVHQGAIARHELPELLGRLAGTPGMFGSSLVKKRIITREQLRAALGQQMQDAFYRIFTADIATYHFAQGVQLITDPDLRSNATHMILECIRRADELARGPH